MRVFIGIEPPCQPDRILIYISARFRIIISETIIVQPSLDILILSLKPNWLRYLSLLYLRSSICVIVRFPYQLAILSRHFSRRPQIIYMVRLYPRRLFTTSHHSRQRNEASWYIHIIDNAQIALVRASLCQQDIPIP